MSHPQNPYKSTDPDEPYEVDADADYATESYQSGRPLLQSQSQAPISISTNNASYYPTTTPPDHASYVTSIGWPLHHLVRIPWICPPFTGVAVLIFETSNDLVRFHAYQASLCGVGAILFYWILTSLFGVGFLSLLFWIVAPVAAWYAGQLASEAVPTLSKHPYLPVIGPIAEEWVGGE